MEPAQTQAEMRDPIPWRAVALSSDVPGDKPVGVLCDGHPVVLFRDAGKSVRALEDRCPHRRAPLSLGRMKPDGTLQCGYHGWMFDGETGACKGIANLRADERVPARYGAVAYQAVERGGLVFVWCGERTALAPPAPEVTLDVTRMFAGSTIVSLDHDQYVAALLDGPELLLRIHGVQLTDYFLTDPLLRDGRLTMDRGVVGASRWLNHRFVSNYPYFLRLALEVRTGMVSFNLLTEDEEPVVEGVVASTPADRGATSVCWLAGVSKEASGRLAAKLRGRNRSPLDVFDHVNGKRLSTLLVGPSREWRRLSAPLAVADVAHAA